MSEKHMKKIPVDHQKPQFENFTFDNLKLKNE